MKKTKRPDASVVEEFCKLFYQFCLDNEKYIFEKYSLYDLSKLVEGNFKSTLKYLRHSYQTYEKSISLLSESLLVNFNDPIKINKTGDEMESLFSSLLDFNMSEIKDNDHYYDLSNISIEKNKIKDKELFLNLTRYICGVILYLSDRRRELNNLIISCA